MKHLSVKGKEMFSISKYEDVEKINASPFFSILMHCCQPRPMQIGAYLEQLMNLRLKKN